MTSTLDKQRVDVGYAKNVASSYFNLKDNRGFCQTHNLTKDVYGREVGDFGIVRYDSNCGNKFDKVHNLNDILQRENKLRPIIFQDSLGAMEGSSGVSESPYLTIDNAIDMRIIPSDLTDDNERSVYKEPIVFH